MPTPGGLFKTGDILVFGDEATRYVVMNRTSNSVPYTLRIRRQDGRMITFRASPDKFRNNRHEYLLMLETPDLPGQWTLWDPEHNRAQALAQDLPGNLRALVEDPTPAEAAAAAADEVLGNPVKPAHHRERERQREPQERHGRMDKHYAPPCDILFKDAHRWKDPADAAYYREETEGLLTNKNGWTRSIIFGDDELMDFCVRGLTYLRDKNAGKQ